MESINDIGLSGSDGLTDQSVSADDIEAGMQQIIARAHEKGIRIIGATLTPYGDTTFPGYYDEKGEAKREAVNGWIRTSGQFDGVIDFDAVMRDPARPDHLRAIYDHGDHLHMNDAGYREMAEAINFDVILP